MQSNIHLSPILNMLPHEMSSPFATPRSAGKSGVQQVAQIRPVFRSGDFINCGFSPPESTHSTCRHQASSRGPSGGCSASCHWRSSA